MSKQNKKINEIAVQKPRNKLNTHYLVGVFVVVIIIVGFGLIVNGEISGRATWSKVRPVKATSCDADEVCEAKNIRVDGDSWANGKTGGGSADFIEVEADTVYARHIQLLDSSGAGIHYACIDNDGYIFSSSTPCVAELVLE